MQKLFKVQFEVYTKAVLKKDLDLFISLFDENILAFDMWDQWSVNGLTEWRKITKEWFDSLVSEQVAVEFSEIRESSSGDLGYVSAFVKFEAQTLTGETIRYLENRLTWVLERKNNVWKIIHQHTSSPVDDSMKARLKRVQG